MTLPTSARSLLGLFTASLLAACGPSPVPLDDAGVVDAGGEVDAGVVDAGPVYQPVCTAATPVACEDQSFLTLDMKKNVAAGLVTNAGTDGGFISVIDAVAGGAFNITDSYTYAKFTPAGLTKVLISDEAAYASMDWDIGFRRFVIRLNGGDSGPSCVGAVKLPSGTPYDGLSSEPVGAVYSTDEFLTDHPACAFVDDGQGLTSAPATALSSYYQYSGCVKMSGNVFLIRTAEGRKLKFNVMSYYAPASAQNTCNTNNTPGGTAATFNVRWAFID